jgi:hypothetical protein
MDYRHKPIRRGPFWTPIRGPFCVPIDTLGYDRILKSNTTKRRTHSLFRQGCMLYDLIPTMPDKRLLPLIEKFAAMLAEVPVFANTFGAV